MRKNSINRLKTLITLVNNQGIGSIITRKEIITVVEGTKEFKFQYSTDNYRNQLCKAGYLFPKDKPGEYRVVKHIPEEMTSTRLKRQAYAEKNNP